MDVRVLAYLFVVTAGLILASCGTRSAAPPPTATQPPPTAGGGMSPVQRHQGYLIARSFTPDRHLTVSLPAGRTLYVFHSVCTGSSDGHCQSVDAFLDDALRPIWSKHYAAVGNLTAIGNGFEVVASSYKAGDPLCCPSGPTVRDRYVWNGNRLVASGPPTQTPGG